MHASYSLTPRLLLVASCSLLALLVLVFLLGMEVGRLSALPAVNSTPLPPRAVQPPPAGAKPASAAPAVPGH